MATIFRTKQRDEVKTMRFGFYAFIFTNSEEAKYSFTLRWQPHSLVNKYT
jgi:hypothetical protein